MNSNSALMETNEMNKKTETFIESWNWNWKKYCSKQCNIHIQAYINSIDAHFIS